MNAGCAAPSLRIADIVCDATNRLREAGVESPSRDARLLLAHALKTERLQIYLRFEQILTDEEVNSLYNHPKIKVHITFTKGEGFGRPLAEASLSQKPIIAPNWSGHIDFLKEAVLLPGQLTNVHQSAAWENVLLQESQWMSVDFGYAMGVMRSVHEEYKNYKDLGKKQAYVIKSQFSLEAMDKKLAELLDKYVPEFPTQTELKLPELKKIQLPKLKKVE